MLIDTSIWKYFIERFLNFFILNIIIYVLYTLLSLFLGRLWESHFEDPHSSRENLDGALELG